MLAIIQPEAMQKSALKITQSLRCAFLIDHAQLEEARYVLKGLLSEEFSKEERDL